MATMESVGESGLLFKQEVSKALNNLRAQRQEGKNCDLTLIVSGTKHVAHRSILAASSPFFEKLLKNQRVPKEGISIDWKDSKSFETLINYLYTGEILLHEGNIDQVIHLADHFMINKLKSHCEEYFRQFVSLENCLKVKDTIDSFHLTDIRDTVNQFIADHVTDVLTQTALLQLSFDKFACFIADPATGCDSISHHTLLTAISSWVKFDLDQRANDFPNLLEVVNWSDADPSEIIKHIESESLYQESKECLFFMLRALVKSNVEIGTYAEVYEELCDKFQDTLPQSDEASATITNDEPPESSPTTRRGTRTRAAAAASTAAVAAPSATPTRSSARKRPAPAAAVVHKEEEDEDEEPDVEAPSSSGRPSRRRVKPKAFSSDWVTDDDHAESSSRTTTATSAVTASPAKRPKRTPTIVKIEAVGENGEPIPGQAEIGIEVDEFEDDVEEDSEDTANEALPNHDDEEAALKRIASRTKSLAHVTKSQWKQGIKCEDCSYVGYSALRLDQHFQKVHAEAQTFTCRQCDFECKWNREYYKHMKSHYAGPPYKCDDCEYTCDRIQFILSHRMKHTDERPFGCELCDFSSRTKGNLIVHMRIHTGEKPYRCQHCGRCFAMKNTLDQHMATHREDRPFLCESCGFTTKYKSHLLSHERIHSGNVFHCEQNGCNYFSPRRSQLAAHMRSHMMIRSHICSTCGRGFIEKSHLIRHERIHLETKPFKCDICDYGSTRRDKLKEHKLKYHPNGEDAVAAAPTPTSAAKSSSYRSRSKRNAAARSLRIMGQGDVHDVEVDEGEQGTVTHVVHITNGDGGDEDMNEQDVATAYLIDEYGNCEGTGQMTRIVFAGDSGEQAVYVEGEPGSVDGENSGEAGEVIIVHAATADE